MNGTLERIFFPLNIDDNGRLISKLLQPVKLQIFRALAEDRTDAAVTLYIRLLATLSRCYVEHRHYLYVDSRYFPDVDCTDIFRWLQDCGEHGKLSMENRQRLQATLQELKQAEAFREYEIPTVCKLKINIK